MDRTFIATNELTVADILVTDVLSAACADQGSCANQRMLGSRPVAALWNVRMIRRDYLERMIQQLGDALARAVGLAKAGKHDEAIREIDALYDRNIGMPRRMLERLELGSVRSMVGTEKLAALVLLLETEAELRRTKGDPAGAEACERRALALREG